MTDLLTNPLWQRDDLGKPLPNDPHAVSVCLPLWEHNVGYEEADPAVVSKMNCGYPRFFLHPLVGRLFAACETEFANDNECCFAFPSQRVARRCVKYLRRHTGDACSMHEFSSGQVFAVCLPKSARKTAMQFWQHAGDIISSRLAAAVLEENSEPIGATNEKQILRGRIAGFVGCDAVDVYLFPSGMAAIFAAYRVFEKLRPDLQSVQFGFPYVDILKIQERFGTGVHLFPNGDSAELGALQSVLASERVMGLFCEFPGNPLLKSPDLQRLAELSRAHEFPLLVDDTLGAMINVDTLPIADMVATSLTKFFSGKGDVIAGALVLNADKPFYEDIRSSLNDDFEDLLFDADAIVLEQNSRDCADRVRRINSTTEQLCDVIRQHPAVERVDYPKFQTPENYDACKRPGGGYGGLFSIQLRNPSENAPRFYDALRISKGPNLGTNFSLCCPFTILAHYNELDFAANCGISQYLLRVSIGLENPDWLAARFTEALDRLP